MKEVNQLQSINFRCKTYLKDMLIEQAALEGKKPGELARDILEKELKKLEKKNGKLEY